MKLFKDIRESFASAMTKDHKKRMKDQEAAKAKIKAKGGVIGKPGSGVKLKEEDKDPCWKDYQQIGMKKKGGKEVPNCVPKESIEEATTGRNGVKCSAEKSQFGGYTPTCTRNGKGIYSAQQAYTDADTAKKHAEVYADAYYGYGERQAQKAVRDFVAKNKSKLRTKNESIEEATTKFNSIGDFEKAAKEKGYTTTDDKKRGVVNAFKGTTSVGRYDFNKSQGFLKEAADKSSDVYKEYLLLKKKSIADLRKMIGQMHRGAVDLKSYDKEGAISDILVAKFGRKAVVAGMGLDEAVEEGKLPPHLSKFFDKKGNLNKDAEERVKQGRKKRGLDQYTGKKLESVEEATKYSVLDTKKNQIVSKPNITKAAAQKLVDKDPKNRIMGSPEFIHDKRTSALKEETELQEYGVMSKQAFKRQEHEFEAELDRQAELQRKANDAMARVIWIDGKVWKKDGKPVEFNDKKHAQNVIRTLSKKNPEKDFTAGSIAYYKQEGDTLKHKIKAKK